MLLLGYNRYEEFMNWVYYCSHPSLRKDDNPEYTTAEYRYAFTRFISNLSSTFNLKPEEAPLPCFHACLTLIVVSLFMCNASFWF